MAPLREQITRKQGEKWQFSSHVSQNALELLSSLWRIVLTTELPYPTMLGFCSCCCYVLVLSVPGWYSSPLWLYALKKNWVACRFSLTRSCTCQLLLLLFLLLLMLLLLYRNELFLRCSRWWVMGLLFHDVIDCCMSVMWSDLLVRMHSSLLDLSLPHWYICWSLVLRICCC